MAKETKQKIFHLFEDSQDLNNKSTELLNLEKQTLTNSGLQNRNEIILKDNEYFDLSQNYQVEEYSFENLSDEDIRFIHPIIIYETTSGYNFTTVPFNFTVYHFWQKLDNRYKLMIRHRALIYDPETSSSFTIPIYVTIKLIIYNDRVYKTIQ